MRYSFIKTLTKEAQKNKRIMLLTGDLGFTIFEDFQKEFPDRFINVGVAEQNMMGLAAGLALSGKIVFAYSIATFATMRAFEQIRNNIAAHNAHVIIVGSGCGLSYGPGGFTHQSIEDISLMRSIPNMTVISPADPIEVMWATKFVVGLRRPIYLRIGKKGEEFLHKKIPKLKLGKGYILRRGNDFAILATGNMVINALRTADILYKRNNIQSTVVSLHTLKPLDSRLIKNLAQRVPLIVTVEEHSEIGGLGSAVAEIIAGERQNTRLVRIAIPDRFIIEVGSQEHLRQKLGLDPETIAKKIKVMLN